MIGHGGEQKASTGRIFSMNEKLGGEMGPEEGCKKKKKKSNILSDNDRRLPARSLICENQESILNLEAANIIP